MYVDIILDHYFGSDPEKYMFSMTLHGYKNVSDSLGDRKSRKRYERKIE